MDMHKHRLSPNGIVNHPRPGSAVEEQVSVYISLEENQGLDKNLHSAAEMEDQVESRLLLDVTAGVSKTCLMSTKGKLAY